MQQNKHTDISKQMQVHTKYRFSFTAASLLLKEFAELAAAKCNGDDLLPELLGRDRVKTGIRKFAVSHDI